VTAQQAKRSSTGDAGAAAERAHSGEINTLVDIYGKHERRIYRYCLSLLRNPEDAEDATQETFTRAAPFLPNLAGDLSAYLTTVARNICCDVVRARARRAVPLDNISVADRSVNPERESLDWDVVRRMWRQLSPSERLLFAYTFAGYRYEEIATRTGMSRPSVSVGLTRARRRLRDLATAIGALGLLPLGLRRLLDRLTRRVNSAMLSGQQVLVAVVEQAGATAATIIAALIAMSPGGGAPAMAATSAHHAHPAPEASITRAAQQAVALAPTTRTERAQPAPHRVAPAPAAQPLPPALNQAATDLQGYTTTPADSSANSVTASPDFAHDRTLFVTAVVNNNGCASGNVCPALFRSTDGGSSWARLWPGVYQGGLVLLPPTYPTDPGVFVINSGGGLMISPGGDGTFTNVVPGATSAAVAPGSAPGRARFAVIHSYNTLLSYTVGDTTALPGPALPTGMVAIGVAFVGGDRVLVTGYRIEPSGLSAVQVPMLVSCPLSGTCAAPVVLSDTAYGFVYLASGPMAPDGVVAYGPDHAYLSSNQGRSFSVVYTAPAGLAIDTAGTASTGAGSRLVLGLSASARPGHTTLMWSSDMGRTFHDASGDLDAVGRLVAANVLDDGDVILGLTSDTTGHFALRESAGDGHWAAPRPS